MGSNECIRRVINAIEDKPRGNGMVGSPKRAQTPVPNSNRMVGSLKRHQSPPGRSRKLFLCFLRMREVSLQEPEARLSVCHTGGWEGVGNHHAGWRLFILQDHSILTLGKSVQWGCTDNVTVGWKGAAKDMMATLVCHWEERDSPTPYSCHYTRPSLVDVLVAKSKCSPPGRH